MLRSMNVKLREVPRFSIAGSRVASARSCTPDREAMYRRSSKNEQGAEMIAGLERIGGRVRTRAVAVASQ